MLNTTNQIVKSLKQGVAFRHLKRELRHSYLRFSNEKRPEHFTELLNISGVLLALAAILFVFHGYHAAFHTINDISAYLPETLLQNITFIGDTAFALSVMIFFARRNPSTVWVTFCAAIIGTIVSHAMKDYFAMPRPPAVLAPVEFVLIGKAVFKGSFPSGHSLTAFALVSVLYYFSNRKPTRVALLLFGSVIALSRVLVSAHWPIDVLVGSALGILSSLAGIYVARRLKFGFHVITHNFVISLYIISTVTLFNHDGGYPLAANLGFLVGITSLAYYINEYIVTPTWKHNRHALKVMS